MMRVLAETMAALRGDSIALIAQLPHLCCAMNVADGALESCDGVALARSMAAQCACFALVSAVAEPLAEIGTAVAAFSGAQHEWSAMAKANAGADETVVTTSSTAMAKAFRTG